MLQNADNILILDARDEETRLEQGLPWNRYDLQATADVECLYRTGRSHEAGGFMPEHPEYVHLPCRQVIVRRNGAWEI
jgi:hypothetical protein